MDRLVCGDVGFGKTEVAIRAAFKAAVDGKQVAVLVPTTILALQHYRSFSERLRDFPVRIEYLNRTKSAKETAQILRDLESGHIDILIGTHKMLGANVKFHDLGLLIIDEEQRFGVAAKEKLTQLSVSVDTLTLTATPIPRTLQFSLMGSRDLSVISTPPPNRQPILTESHVFSEEIIRDAVETELARGGQVYFVHNRVEDLPALQGLITRLCPKARLAVGHGKMPADPVMVKTIVTMDMGEQIATHYGLRTINVLTGFKFIGEQIGKLEKQGRADSYVFGFEESYGYLTGSYVRDKDGVDGAYMICEMFSYYATKGISLLDKLDELYKTYGYCLNTLHSYEFDGSAGFAKMQIIMQAFRGNIKGFGGKKVVKLLDYAPGLDGLPKSDVLKFLLEDNCSIVVRPSGTEPKLKIYISVSAENKEAAEKVEAEIAKAAEKWLR